METLTAIIVTHGDDPRLLPCLEALLPEWPTECLEVFVVENGADGEGPGLPDPVRRMRRSENPGFAAAFNEALQASSGELVLSLNPDALVHPGALEKAAATLRCESRVGAVALRLVRPGGEVLDSAGIRLGTIRRARDRGMGGSATGTYPEREDVDAACMAAALFPRRALEMARDGAGEVLDVRFFAYKEDVDLGWRIRRAGFRIVYEPGAVATHERGWREGGRREIPVRLRVLSLRNRWFTILKNESPLSLALRMALYVPTEIALAAWLTVREPGVLRAYPELIRGVGETLRRRTLASDRV